MSDRPEQPDAKTRLAEVFELHPRPDELWSESDLAGMLRHQLAASVEAELVEFSPTLSSRLRGSGGAMAGLTFGAALCGGTCGPALLELIKEHGKAIYHRRCGAPVPRDVGKVLYFAALAASSLRSGGATTQLDEPALHAGYMWAIERSWMDPVLRHVFERALAR